MAMKKPYPMVRPGMLGSHFAADSRRLEFDLQNEQLLYNEKSIDFIFIGDSITHFWDLPSFFARKGQVLVNKGISGDQSASMGQRFEADVLQLRPEYVVMKIGINNCWALDAWVPNERKTAARIRQEILADIQEMSVRAADNGIIPILCSILPTCLDVLSTMDAKNELILAINGDLKDFAAAKNYIYVDYHADLCQEDGKTLRSELAFDGVHPDVYGYQVMARTLESTLAKRGIDI